MRAAGRIIIRDANLVTWNNMRKRMLAKENTMISVTVFHGLIAELILKVLRIFLTIR